MCEFKGRKKKVKCIFHKKILVMVKHISVLIYLSQKITFRTIRDEVESVEIINENLL